MEIRVEGFSRNSCNEEFKQFFFFQILTNFNLFKYFRLKTTSVFNYFNVERIDQLFKKIDIIKKGNGLYLHKLSYINNVRRTVLLNLEFGELSVIIHYSSFQMANPCMYIPY